MKGTLPQSEALTKAAKEGDTRVAVLIGDTESVTYLYRVRWDHESSIVKRAIYCRQRLVSGAGTSTCTHVER